MPTWQGVALHASVEWPALTPDDLVLVPGWRDRLRRHSRRRRCGGWPITTPPAARSPASAPAPTRSAGPACSTAGAAPPTTTCRTIWPATTRGRSSCATCSTSATTAWSPRPASPAASTWRCTWSPSGTARRRRPGWPARWSSTPGATATSRRPARCCGTGRTCQRRGAPGAGPDRRRASPRRCRWPAWPPARGVSERTLTRLFTDATGQTPLRYQQVLRVERAEYLIGHGATVEAAARAVGFADARMLRRLRARQG